MGFSTPSLFFTRYLFYYKNIGHTGKISGRGPQRAISRYIGCNSSGMVIVLVIQKIKGINNYFWLISFFFLITRTVWSNSYILGTNICYLVTRLMDGLMDLLPLMHISFFYTQMMHEEKERETDTHWLGMQWGGWVVGGGWGHFDYYAHCSAHCSYGVDGHIGCNHIRNSIP